MTEAERPNIPQTLRKTRVAPERVKLAVTQDVVALICDCMCMCECETAMENLA